MGLNVFAGITNVNIAFLSNMINAAGGEDFSNKEFMNATSTMLNSTRNVLPGAIVGGAIGTIFAPGVGTIFGAGIGSIFTSSKSNNKVAKKIKAMMTKLEVLGDITEQGSEKGFFDKVGIYSLVQKLNIFLKVVL